MQFHKSKTIPENSFIGQDFGSIDYIDAFTIRLKSNETLGELSRKIFSSPKWVLALMGIRNSIVKPFGLKTGRNKRINRNTEIEIGKKKNNASSLPPPFTKENPIFKQRG